MLFWCISYTLVVHSVKSQWRYNTFFALMTTLNAPVGIISDGLAHRQKRKRERDLLKLFFSHPWNFYISYVNETRFMYPAYVSFLSSSFELRSRFVRTRCWISLVFYWNADKPAKNKNMNLLIHTSRFQPRQTTLKTYRLSQCICIYQ